MAKKPPTSFNGSSITHHAGKGSQMLPGAGALRSLASTPGGASITEYGAKTPSGRNAPSTYGEIEKLGRKK